MIQLSATESAGRWISVRTVLLTGLVHSFSEKTIKERIYDTVRSIFIGNVGDARNRRMRYLRYIQTKAAAQEIEVVCNEICRAVP